MYGTRVNFNLTARGTARKITFALVRFLFLIVPRCILNIYFCVGTVLNFKYYAVLSNHGRMLADLSPLSPKKKYSAYTFKCRKHIDCPFQSRLNFVKQVQSTDPTSNRHSWIVFCRGVHSEGLTSIQVKKGIDPLYLNFVDFENERNTAPKQILRRMKDMDWPDQVPFPTTIQISNRKALMCAKKEGPVTKYQYAPNLIKWVNDNLLKTKEQFDCFPQHQFFTMGYVEYQKNTKNGGQELCIAFTYTTKGKFI